MGSLKIIFEVIKFNANRVGPDGPTPVRSMISSDVEIYIKRILAYINPLFWWTCEWTWIWTADEDAMGEYVRHTGWLDRLHHSIQLLDVDGLDWRN